MKRKTTASEFLVFMALLIFSSLCVLPRNVYGGPSTIDPEIYVVDNRKTPGVVIEVRRDAIDARRPLTYSTTESDPAVTAIAFYEQSELYFVSADSRRIMKTDGREMRLVYEHSTYIRDIAFDSRGNLFFSEANGAAEDGRIFLLGFLGSYDEAGPPWRTIELGQIGGFWAGNFAFDPSDKLFISTGNRVPAAIYEYTSRGFERRYSFNEPITGFAFQHGRRILFTNHKQALYGLQDFSVRSTVFSDPRADWLNDVAVVTGYSGASCSISGRLHGGEGVWNMTYINVTGPNIIWRYPASAGARVSSDGSYVLSGLAPGMYWVNADIRGDIGRSFRPSPLVVVCPAGGERRNQDFRFE